MDSGQMTIGRLNAAADTWEKPGAIFRLSREPIDHVQQPTNMTCWAAKSPGKTRTAMNTNEATSQMTTRLSSSRLMMYPVN